MHPDFIFFIEQNGKFVTDAVDPHGTRLPDALNDFRAVSVRPAHPEQAGFFLRL